MVLDKFPDSKFRMTDKSIILDYIHGGKGELLIVSPSMKAHRYRFKFPTNSSKFPLDVVFVYVVHDDKEMYLGIFDIRGFRLTQNSRFLRDSEVAKGAQWLSDVLFSKGKFENSPMKIFSSGRCARCGKLLNSDKAISLGFGRKCSVIHKSNVKLSYQINYVDRR